jgi:hypothetical protein
MQTSKYFSFVLSIWGVNSGFSAMGFLKRFLCKDAFEVVFFLLIRLTIYAFPHFEGSKQLAVTTS